MHVKPYLTFEQQVNLLQTRGLVVDDIRLAQDILASINYCRFTGYALAFMETPERFKAGVTFDHVFQVIRFDEKLRDLLAIALECIEIDFRTTFAYQHSMRYNVLGYTDSRNFCDPQKHSSVLEKVEQEIANSKEKYIQHLRLEYGNVPVWAMVEVVSFGSIVRMFRSMPKGDQPHIARRYAMKSDILGSYIQHISVVRNMCAHHSRLWDKIFYGVRPLNHWRKANLPVVDTQHLFHTLLLVYRLTQHIPAVYFDRTAWRYDLIALLKEFQKLPNCNTFEIMGIPANGFEDVWWE